MQTEVEAVALLALGWFVLSSLRQWAQKEIRRFHQQLLGSFRGIMQNELRNQRRRGFHGRRRCVARRQRDSAEVQAEQPPPYEDNQVVNNDI